MLAALVLACAVPGCRHEDEDLGLRQRELRPVALDHLTEPSALLAALGQPGASLDASLGARGFDLQRSLELSAGSSTDRTEETVRFDADGKGGFWLVHELGHPAATAPGPVRGEGPTATRDQVDPSAQGMEAVALDGKIFVRPRYGRFVERRPEPEELGRLREIGEQLLADDLEVLAPALAISAAGEGNVLGRPTRRLKLERAAVASPVPPDEDPRRAWRASVKVTTLSGELELDAATGALRGGRLDARYELVRGGRTVSAHVVDRLSPRGAAALSVPEGAVESPRRPRPTVERNQLLEGLAPPVGTHAARGP